MSISEAGRGSADQIYAALQNVPLEFVPTNFQAHTRVVLPLDSYIFWRPTVPLTIVGSLHYSQEIVQGEDETYGQGTIFFTAEERVTQFEEAPINTLFVSKAGGFFFAFSQQQGFYSQAGLWHYFGHSIPPAMTSQFLSSNSDNPNSPQYIDPNQAVVSNSLPLWLALNNYECPYSDGFSNFIELFPSYIVAPNQVPPYGAVHIGEEDTRALAAAPYLTINRSHSQLVADKVKITLYGLQNNAAMDFIDCVLQYSIDTNNFGIMNMPVVTDAKRSVAELQALGMKKTITFEISYHQQRAAVVARQLIVEASATFQFEGGNPAGVSVLVTDTGQTIITDTGQPIQVT